MLPQKPAVFLLWEQYSSSDRCSWACGMTRSPGSRLNSVGMSVAAAVGGDPLGDLQDRLRVEAADLGDHLRRVAGVVPLEHLEDAARVLQGLVALRLDPHGRAAAGGGQVQV